MAEADRMNPEICMAKIRMPKTCSTAFGTGKIGRVHYRPSQIGSREVRFAHAGTDKPCAAEINAFEFRAIEVRVAQIGDGVARFPAVVPLLYALRSQRKEPFGFFQVHRA